MNPSHSDILFIINPNSGNRKTQRIVHSLELREEKPDYIITRNLDHLDEVFRKSLETHTYFVIVGGDGSIHKALPYLVNKENKFLAIFPKGSGNGFAKEMGFKNNLDVLMNDIKQGKSESLDLMDINGSLSINVSGLGIDSYVAHRFANTKRRGFFNYLLITTKALVTFKSFEAFLEIDKKPIAGKYMMISIANTRQFGNNAFIAPQAKPHDGKYDLVLVKPMPFYRYPGFVVRMFKGNLKRNKYVHYIQTDRTLKIRSTMNEYHLDGEPYVLDGETSIDIKKSSIQVIRTQAAQV